ncbi:MAG: hypothetical protein ACFCD0_07585 [Gemmataceae bacterium]
MRVVVSLLLVGIYPVLLVLPSAYGCSLCGALQSRRTIRSEFTRAKIVAVGTISNPRFSTAPSARPGSGTTDFYVQFALKGKALLGKRRQLLLDRYLAIPDPKSPPRFLVFFDIVQGKLDPYHGRYVTSPAMLEYVKKTQYFSKLAPVARLQTYFPYFAHEDQEIAFDAFLEFAKASDQEVKDVAQLLPIQPLRDLLTNKATPTERINLYAFLVGVAGGEQDARLLRKMINNPTARTRGAMQGLLSGYLALEPTEGWKLVYSMLSDPNLRYSTKFSTAQVLRFYHGLDEHKYRPQVLHGLQIILRDPDLADVAIGDLRRWKMWDLTKEVLAHYDKKNYSSPLIRRGIIRYALSCNQPAAASFVKRVEGEDPRLIADVRKSLEWEARTLTPPG